MKSWQRNAIRKVLNLKRINDKFELRFASVLKLGPESLDGPGFIFQMLEEDIKQAITEKRIEVEAILRCQTAREWRERCGRE